MVLCAWHNSALFVIDPTTGLMDRFCGDGSRPCFGPASDPQDVTTVCVDLPSSVLFDAQGRLVFTDQGNHIVRRIENGMIETIVGTQPLPDSLAAPPNPVGFSLQFGFTGDGGPATSAKLQFERGQIADPSGKICYDAAGNLYIADTANHAVRMVDTNDIITRIAGAPPITDGMGKMIGQAGYSGDGGPATSAKLYEPRDVAVDFDGTLFIADTGNNVIRMVSPGGTISTVVGVHRRRKPSALLPNVLLAEDGASAKAVRLTEPSGVAVDGSGRLWIADTGNNVIRIFDR
jgi:streptogramin lyase